MKRRIFKHVLFLILGVIVNVAVAWGCAIWSGSNSESSISSNLVDKKYDPTIVPNKLRKSHESYLPPELKIRNKVNSRRIALGYSVHSIRSLENSKHYMETAALSVGWPALTLFACHTYYSKPGETDDLSDRIIAEWESGTLLVLGERRMILGHPLWPPFRLLPFYPIWPGFVINTILYTIALKVLMIIPWIMRRNSRLLKGHCPKCGYLLHGNYTAGCPECGWGREAEG